MATRKSPEHREQKRVVAPFDSEVEQGELVAAAERPLAGRRWLPQKP
jgi:hypothetical protein